MRTAELLCSSWAGVLHGQGRARDACEEALQGSAPQVCGGDPGPPAGHVRGGHCWTGHRRGYRDGEVSRAL